MHLLIYHIRYISTSLPAARLVLGTTRAMPFVINLRWEILLRAPFPHLQWIRIWHSSAHRSTFGLLDPTTALHHTSHPSTDGTVCAN